MSGAETTLPNGLTGHGVKMALWQGSGPSGRGIVVVAVLALVLVFCALTLRLFVFPTSTLRPDQMRSWFWAGAEGAGEEGIALAKEGYAPTIAFSVYPERRVVIPSPTSPPNGSCASCPTRTRPRGRRAGSRTCPPCITGTR